MNDEPDAPSGTVSSDEDAARLMPRPQLPGPGDVAPETDATQAVPRPGAAVARPAAPPVPTDPRSASAAGSDRTSVLPRPPVDGTTIAPAPGPPGRRPPSPPRPPSRAVPRRAAPAATPSPRRRRRWRRWVAVVVVLALALPVLLFGYGWVQWNRIERVDVSSVLSSPGGRGTNYLIVGSDTREGIDPDDPNAGAFLGSEVSGERTDTIMVLRVEGDRSFLLSIPRDLFVTNAATGEAGRINAVYRSGPAALIQTVQSVGIPIHRYIEVDFVSFAGLVDAVGGITIDFPNPARDEKSGLNIEQPGPATLDGEQALAYVRSRSYTELIDGEFRTDPTGDIGRTERQRQFLSALLGKVTASRNPLELVRISSALGGGLRIDDGFTYFKGLGLAWNLRDGFDPESVVLPTTPRRTSGGAEVLDVDAGAAEAVLGQFNA